MSFGDLLVSGATWALGLGGAWALLIGVAATLEVLSSGRLALTSRTGCPAPVRRVLLAGLGVLLAGAGAVASPVSAAPTPSGSRGQLGLPVPVRPTGAAYAEPRRHVEVRPGDCLWRLAHRRSPPGATDREVARLVTRTYRSNRRVIGPDPDLIQPGQQLRLPRQRPATDRPNQTTETP
jgi:hypothetical protein